MSSCKNKLSSFFTKMQNKALIAKKEQTLPFLMPDIIKKRT